MGWAGGWDSCVGLMTWKVGCRVWWDGLEDGIGISFRFPKLSFWRGKSRFVVSKAYNLLQKQLWV